MAEGGSRTMLPGVGLDQARQELEQRGLADAVGSDHPDTGVGADGDRGPVDDRAAAPVMGEVARHQRGRWGSGCYGVERCAGNGGTSRAGGRGGHGITGSQRTSPG